MQPMPRVFARRMTWSVILIFVVTMAVFLWIAYRSERSRHTALTFKHLAETASVLLPLIDHEDANEGVGLSELERRLAERTGVAHRVLIANTQAVISRASQPSLRGTALRVLYELRGHGKPESGAMLATGLDGKWFVVSIPAGTGERLYLMRSRKGETSLLRQFWAIHGVHVGVTVFLLLLLLKFLGERFVRRPIEQLSAHVDRVQSGEFQTRPETYSQDEFGWLAERFSEMGLRLRETVESLVRVEKSASATAVAYRVAREVKRPLANLRRHLVYLEGLSGADQELLSVGRRLREDLRALVQAVVRLEQLMPEADTDPGDDQGDQPGPGQMEGA